MGLCLSSAADFEHFDVAFQVVTLSAELGVVAAEDRASVVLFPVMASEAATPSGLCGGVVLFDCGGSRRVLVVAALDRVAGFAIHEFDVLGVRELGAESPAGEFCVVGFWLRFNHTLRVADHAIALHFSFFVEAAGRMAFVTFGVRGDGNG